MYSFFANNQIKPKGWLKRQLELQAEGLSGNLDKIWPDIKDSAWIGGEQDGWERVPYWLDGFIPLAYLLDDEDMISRAERYVTAILDRQQPDGWICPCTEDEYKSYDIWPLFLIGKVLTLYCEFSQSKRAQEGLYKAMKNLKMMLDNHKIKLFSWGKFRWFEAFIPLIFLHERYQEEWIIELGRSLREQGADYLSFEELWKVPLNKWCFETHIVNIGMMFKYEVLVCRLLGEAYENHAERLWKLLEKYNGTAVGTFTGDECLAGLSNIQGTELCSVVELMYSCELLYAYTGHTIWADRLEKIAFNALPATLSDDMWTHQYDQMVNQIACQKFPGKPIFSTNQDSAHLFGLEPNFGCCTANFNQGWPKLAKNVFLRTDKGILCALLLPAELNTRINGTLVNITTRTEYPFRHMCEFIVTAERPVEFELKIRIPRGIKSVTLNGKSVLVKRYIHIKKTWHKTQTISLEWEDNPRLVNRPYGLKTLEYGPLVFSLPIKAEYIMHEYTQNGVERKFPYCDYELIPQSSWNYGFKNTDFEIVEKEGNNIPFSSQEPLIKIKATMCKIDWGYEDGYNTVSAKIPKSKKALSKPEILELFPYGCAKLRMTEMPKIR